MKKQYTATGFNLSNFLNDVVAHSQALRDKIVAAQFLSQQNVVEMHLQGTITTQDDLDLQQLLDDHNAQPDSPYKIMSLVNPDFRGLPIENVDFKRHLRGDIALDKKVTMHSNGRPEKSEYYNGTDLVCKITFTFQDANFLLTERKEFIHQMKEDGSWSDGFLIKKKTYDHTHEVDGFLAVEERIDARKHIISSMKAFLSGVIMTVLQKDIIEVIEMISPFWDASEVQRRKFQEFGTEEWKGFISTLDLASAPAFGTQAFTDLVTSGDIKNAPYAYFKIPIDVHGTTIQDYMVGRLTY